MSFVYGWVACVGVIAAVAFVGSALRALRRERAATLDYSSLPFLEATLGRTHWPVLLAVGWGLALFGLGLALARPSVVAALPIRDAAVVLCIDTSGSMASTDVAPTRSAASRQAAEMFIAGSPAGTRLGLVAFSTGAYPLGPLTDDPDEARAQLARLPPPNGGTAIGDALAAAAGLLPPHGRRAIVLVTDGVNNSGSDPLSVAAQIGARGILLFTVGIGTNGSGELIPGTGEEAAIDENALREIARDGRGTYARVGDASALSARLGALADAAVRERRRIDLTLPCALGAGGLALVTACVGLFVGRIP